MITSTNNDRIKNIVQLNSSSKARHTQNAFVAEGIKMFMEAPLLCINEVYLSEELHDRITHDMKTVLGIQTKITLVDFGSLERFAGKAKRIVDLRNEGK